VVRKIMTSSCKIQAAETFSDAESFFEGLHAEFKARDVDFHGTYAVAVDPVVTPKEHVEMVATEIWKISRSVKDHRKLKSGHRTCFWCSQDEAWKKKSKSSQNPDVSNRDNVGMKRYTYIEGQQRTECDCATQARREAHQLHRCVDAARGARHDSQECGVADTRCDGQQSAGDISSGHSRTNSPGLDGNEQDLLGHDDLQLPSAVKLLEENEGVEMLCWGMKKVAGPLKGKIVAIGVDATCACERNNL
ncbi:hypothetical protein B0H10DRAFT_1998466, partial [Mycena sp. CBHHK59/15]